MSARSFVITNSTAVSARKSWILNYPKQHFQFPYVQIHLSQGYMVQNGEKWMWMSVQPMLLYRKLHRKGEATNTDQVITPVLSNKLDKWRNGPSQIHAVVFVLINKLFSLMMRHRVINLEGKKMRLKFNQSMISVDVFQFYTGMADNEIWPRL